MIEIKDLTISFGKEVICEGINFNISDGDYIGIIGENGTGKTSLLNSIFNINPVKSNKIFIDGIDVNDYKDWNNFGYVLQKFNINHDIPITIKEYLSLYYKDKNKLLKLSKEFEVDKLFDKKFNDLSGGQAQRVNIVKALANDIKYLVLDEPNAGLDESKRDKLYKKLHDLNKDGLTIIVVTHELGQIKDKLHNIYDMKTGLLKGEKNDCKYC